MIHYYSDKAVEERKEERDEYAQWLALFEPKVDELCRKIEEDFGTH